MAFFPLLATSAKVVVVSLLLVEEFLCSVLSIFYVLFFVLFCSIFSSYSSDACFLRHKELL